MSVRGTVHQNIAPLLWRGELSGGGIAVVASPPIGKRLRIHYISYSNDTANAEVECYFDTGLSFLVNKLVPVGCIVAKDFGDFRAVEGQLNESLNISTSVGLLYFNVFYTVF